MGEILEIMMIVLFGASWPMNVIKSYRSKTTKGKSLLFLIFIFVGYICGITAKIFYVESKWYVVFFYIINLIMVGADLVLYYRNYKLENA